MLCNAAASHPTSAKYARLKELWKNANTSCNNAIMHLPMMNLGTFHQAQLIPVLLVEAHTYSILLSVHQSTGVRN